MTDDPITPAERAVAEAIARAYAEGRQAFLHEQGDYSTFVRTDWIEWVREARAAIAAMEAIAAANGNRD